MRLIIKIALGVVLGIFLTWLSILFLSALFVATASKRNEPEKEWNPCTVLVTSSIRLDDIELVPGQMFDGDVSTKSGTIEIVYRGRLWTVPRTSVQIKPSAPAP